MRKTILALFLLVGCSAARLEPLLNASDSKSFDEQLKIHGPVTSDEVSTLIREAKRSDAKRSHNAIALLTLSRDPAAQETLEQLGASTNDVNAWGTATASALLREQLDVAKVPAALERADMAKLALQSSDVKLYRTAFIMARRLKLPELQAEIPKAMRSSDPETRALGVAALSPEQAKGQLAGLKAQLKESNYATFPQLAIALISTRDRDAWEAVARSFEEHEPDHSTQTSFVNHVNFNMTPELYAFMVDRVKKHDKLAEEAYFILVSQVTHETYPCDRFLMTLTLPRLRQAVKTKKRDQDAEVLVTLVSQGSNPSKSRPEWKDLIHGQAAVDFAEKWLKEHP